MYRTGLTQNLAFLQPCPYAYIAHVARYSFVGGSDFMTVCQLGCAQARQSRPHCHHEMSHVYGTFSHSFETTPPGSQNSDSMGTSHHRPGQSGDGGRVWRMRRPVTGAANVTVRILAGRRINCSPRRRPPRPLPAMVVRRNWAGDYPRGVVDAAADFWSTASAAPRCLRVGIRGILTRMPASETPRAVPDPYGIIESDLDYGSRRSRNGTTADPTTRRAARRLPRAGWFGS